MQDLNDQSLFMLCQTLENNEPVTPAYFTGTPLQFKQLTEQPFFNTLHGGQVLADPDDFHLYFPMSLDQFQLFPLAPVSEYVECF